MRIVGEFLELQGENGADLYVRWNDIARVVGRENGALIKLRDGEKELVKDRSYDIIALLNRAESDVAHKVREVERA